MRLFAMPVVAVALCAAPAVAKSRLSEAIEAEAAWKRCVEEHAVRFASQPEPADAIVRAAFGRCTTEQDIFYRKMRRWSKGSLGLAPALDPPELDRQVAKQKKQIEEGAFAAVIDARSKPR